MISDINPFYARASEYIDLDDKFLKLFSPEVLNIFKQNPSKLWNNITILRSSPGGGKTTLLKLFTPQILRKLKETSKHDEQNREIYNALKEFGVYSDDGSINVIGSLLPFNNEYVSIEFLAINEMQKIRIFFSLVNIRIIISILDSIKVLYGFENKEDYKKIQFKKTLDSQLPTIIREIKNGLELYNWACDQEDIICKEIAKVYSNEYQNIEGASTLYALDIFSPKNMLIDDHEVTGRVLIMFDDVHYLSTFQRSHLVSTIIQKRPSTNIWISERLKALTMDELFSEGNTEGRDMYTVYLERFWAKRYSAFEKFARSVADRRIAMAMETSRDLASFLSEDFTKEENLKIEESIKIVEERVKKSYGNSTRYKNWIASKEKDYSDIYSHLVTWRSLEILLFRDKNRSQQRFDFENDSLGEEELEDQEGSDVRTAAQLFLNSEFSIPFYYGISKICRLSSFNIEQFLNIAGHLFEEIKSNEVKQVVNSSIKLEISPKRQEQIIKNLVAKVKWTELTNKVPNFSQIKIFLDAIGEFCKQETHTPNAWNSPGLNGVAILMSDRHLLKDKSIKDKNNIYYNLARCISDCISYNLIDFELNYRCKNRDWMILYLNKIYCAKYNLPMNNGKFKEKTLNELLGWYSNGFQKAQKKLSL